MIASSPGIKQNNIYGGVWNMIGTKYLLMGFEFMIQNF